MKKLRLSLIALAGILFGCQQAELIDPTETVDQSKMTKKTITIRAEMDANDTKAAIDFETGAVTWQSGDKISVLATDENFYDFILTSGAGEKFAEFQATILIPVEGEETEGEETEEKEELVITTVATYPRITEDGAYNMILFGDELQYYLPEEWDYAKDVSNVPMVAAFEEGAENISFKQVGGVMRFPIKNLPANSKVVFTMHDKVITGDFPVDITALGESAMEAYEGTSEVTFNYTFVEDDVEINLPVPTGVYDNFTLTVYNKHNEAIFTKDYSADNVVNRATILLMSEIVVPSQPIEVAEVWPFFVDARVIFPKAKGATQYAVYIDGAEEPVILDAEDWGKNAGVLIGGEFEHKSTHTVAIAKVVDGNVVEGTKSEAVSFTTEDIFQLTKNTGTKFVSVGWNDVSIGYGPKFVDGKWTAVVDPIPDVDAQGRKLHQRRGYYVELYAADKTTKLYDLIPFAGHTIFQTAFYDTSTLGKINGTNIISPTAVTFGHLQPNTDYYFRVKTIDGVEMLQWTKEDGGINYNPNDASNTKAYPYPLSSERGGCAWSNLVKLTTDAPHVPVENEIFFEGFDDLIHNNDPINWSVSVVPDLYTTGSISKAEYLNKSAEGYEAFYNEFDAKFNTEASTEIHWTFSDWNSVYSPMQYGFHDDLTGDNYKKNIVYTYNERAEGLEGWTFKPTTDAANLVFHPGAISYGKSISTHAGGVLTTTPFNHELLDSERPTKCTIKLKLAYMSQGKAEVGEKIYVQAASADGTAHGSEISLSIKATYPDEWAAEFTPHHTPSGEEKSASDHYTHYSRYFELTTEDIYLKRGDILLLTKKQETPQYGRLLVGEVSIVAHPGEFEPEVEQQ